MEKIVDSIVIMLLWIVYATLEGIREAYYYDATMRTDKSYTNIHWVYFVQRGIMLFIVGIMMHSAILPISMALIFPLIHDGCYYAQRNDIDVRMYPRRFKDSSTTSTAFFEFDYKERLTYAYFGIIFFIGYFLLINIEGWVN